MNSCKRCGRSLSSKEESSSTGAAETRRSFRGSEGLSLAADTEGDGSSSEFWVPSLVTQIARDAAMIAAETLRSCAPLGRPRRPSLHELSLPDHSESHALQLAGVEPCDLLAEPDFRATELVLSGRRCEVARAEQVGDRGFAEPGE